MASSLNWHVRQANISFDVMRSSFGYSMLLHSRQKRKVICSWALVGASEAVDGAGEADIVAVIT